MKLTIACVQLNPAIGRVKENTERALQLVERAFAAAAGPKPDLVVFPELALTGYNFKSKAHVQPYLETRGQHSGAVARQISQRFGCYTVMGYPERGPQDTVYNSAVVVSPQGEVVHNYRKTFLYDTDVVWGCRESDTGFGAFEMRFGSRTLRAEIGICMDLNPYRFQAPFMDFEFASDCLANRADLILCPMAWLAHGSPSLVEDAAQRREAQAAATALYAAHSPMDVQINTVQAQHELDAVHPTSDLPIEGSMTQPDKTNVNYWILRFFPFLNYMGRPQSATKPVVVLANRSGLEDDVQYAGSSTILQFCDAQTNTDVYDSRNGSCRVLGFLGRGSEGVLVRQVQVG